MDVEPNKLESSQNSAAHEFELGSNKSEQISFDNSDEGDQTAMEIDQIVKNLEHQEQVSMEEDSCSESNTSEDEEEQSDGSNIEDDKQGSDDEVEEGSEDEVEEGSEDEVEEGSDEEEVEESIGEEEGEEGSDDEIEDGYKEEEVEDGYKEEVVKEKKVEEGYKEKEVEEGYKEDEGEEAKRGDTEGDEDTEDEELHIVEKVLDKRERRGVVEYYIKWQNFSHDFNSWEPEDNMFCQGLIDEFEHRHRINQSRARKHLARRCKQVGERKRSHKRKRKRNAMPKEQNKIMIYEGCGNTYEVVDTEIGFKAGLTPMKILEASKYKGRVVFLMQWQETDSCHFVYHWEAKEKCPKIVLDFYDKFVTWIE